MANLKEQSKWETGIYQIEENDPVLGGEDGITNKPANQLANRTKWLKEQTDNLKIALDNYIPNSKKSSEVTSPSDDTVATSAAAKTAYDKALNALKKATEVDNSALKINGNQSVHGILKAESVNGAWAAYDFATKGGTWHLEVHPDSTQSDGRRFNMVFISDAGIRSYLWFPQISEAGDHVAYRDWVSHEVAKVKSVADGNTRNFANYIANGKKSNAVDSTSTDTVATSIAVKLAYDRGTTANNNANGRVAKSGDTMAGHLLIKQSDYSAVKLINDANKQLILESRPDEANFIGNIIYRNTNGGNDAYISIPKRKGTMALKEDFTNPEFTITNNNINNLNNLNGNRFISFNADRISTEAGLGTGSDWVGVQIADNGWQKTQILSGGWQNHYIRTNDDPGKNVWYLEKLLTDKNFENMVNRRNYSKTIKGTNANWDKGTDKSISVTGYILTLPDGRIEQYFYFRNFRIKWFAEEQARNNGTRVIEIPVQLWTAMPNKIEWLEGHISRTNDTNLYREITVGSEGAEWIKPLWAFEKQGNSKDRCSIYTRRDYGDNDETVDMYIKVMGY